MPIKLSRYKTLKTFNGQSHNKIQVVRDEKLNKKFVLKRMKLEKIEQQMREINIQKQLMHKNIVRLFNYEITDKEIVILMEYAEKGDLYMNLDKFKNMNVKQILKFFKQILDAVNYIHNKGYIHRDIKPENILIDDSFKPLIADFGTAVKKNQSPKIFTGTIGYMAPEVLMKRSFNEKCDVWGLGIMLYELLHDQVLFLNDSLEKIQLKINCNLIEFRPNLPESVKKFIKKMVVWDPKKRPSCQQLLKDEVFTAKFKQQSRRTTLPQKVVGFKKPEQALNQMELIRKQLKSQHKKIQNQKVQKVSQQSLFSTKNRLTKKSLNCGSTTFSMAKNIRTQKNLQEQKVKKNKQEVKEIKHDESKQPKKFLNYLKTDFAKQKNDFSRKNLNKRINSGLVGIRNRTLSKSKRQSPKKTNLLTFQNSMQNALGRQILNSQYPSIYEQRKTMGTQSKNSVKAKSRANIGLKTTSTQKNLKMKRKKIIV